MSELENRIDDLISALDAVLFPTPSDDLTLLVSLLAKKVDEQELSEMLAGK